MNKTNPFDFLADEIIFMILDHLNDEPFARKSFSLTCKTFYSIESRHRRNLKPLCTELLSRISCRYPFISQLDLSLFPRPDDNVLNIIISSTWKSTLRSINLSRSRFFTKVGLSSLLMNCHCLIEIDLSNWTELSDMAAAAIAEAKNLEKLWLARCKSITDMGIGRIAACCRKLRLLCLKWCVRVSDFGVELIALKCKEIRSLDLSYLPVYNIQPFLFFFWVLLLLVFLFDVWRKWKTQVTSILCAYIYIYLFPHFSLHMHMRVSDAFLFDAYIV